MKEHADDNLFVCNQHVNEGTCFHQNNCEVLGGFVCKVELFYVCFCMQVLVV